MTEYGLQLYSVRSAMAADMEGTVEKVAALGYKMVEPAGFFGRSADQFNELMARTGLKLSGTHSAWIDLRDKWDETLAYHKAIGNPRYIIPGAGFGTREETDEVIRVINDVQPRLAAEGIELHYHNHSFEFIRNEAGILPFEELRDRTNVKFEIDTYWAYRAGEDPVKLMKEYADRINVIHVKDGTMQEGLSLGSGTAPVREVVAAAKAMGITMVVESEAQQPDGISEVTRCIDFLKTLG